MGKKVVKTSKAGRGSDQFLVRMPPGLRSTLSEEADRNGRSMNAEIISRLAYSFEIILNPEGLVAMTKRMEAAVAYIEGVAFDIREIDRDLDAFIADHRSKGKKLTRTEAIRLILGAYLSEKEIARERPKTQPHETARTARGSDNAG
jgi:hypothetical protein